MNSTLNIHEEYINLRAKNSKKAKEGISAHKSAYGKIDRFPKGSKTGYAAKTE
jgi:hypothetical protein